MWHEFPCHLPELRNIDLQGVVEGCIKDNLISDVYFLYSYLSFDIILWDWWDFKSVWWDFKSKVATSMLIVGKSRTSISWLQIEKNLHKVHGLNINLTFQEVVCIVGISYLTLSVRLMECCIFYKTSCCCAYGFRGLLSPCPGNYIPFSGRPHWQAVINVTG